MPSRKRNLVVVAVACSALLSGLVAGGVATAAKKKRGAGTAKVANQKSRAIPDAIVGGGIWGALATPLRVGKQFKGRRVDDVRLTVRTTGLAVGSASDLLFRLTAPNGRTIDIAAVFDGQSIGPLTVTPNSRTRICNASPPPCSDPDATLFPPYFGTLGDPNLALLQGAPVSGRWVVTVYDQSNGNLSTLNSVGLVIDPR
jgi:hypothetical protein